MNADVPREIHALVGTSFTHRSGSDFVFDPARTYEQDDTWCKPKGLWLSVDHDWERWLLDGGDWGVNTTSFTVDMARCLIIGSVDELDRFDAEYVVPHTPMFYGKPDRYRIDWRPLAEQVAGIVVAPYQWERRLQGDASRWYYPWDAASACVWDLTAVEPCTPPGQEADRG